MAYSRLTGPLTVRGLELKNRMIIPAMHLACTDNGACTKRFLEFYRRRALGGAGLIITGSCRFDEYGADRLSMSLASDDMIPVWKEFTDEMHKCGCPVAVQLYHAGRYMRRKDVICGRPALSPSEGFCRFTGETAPAMTAEQIEELKLAYHLGAKRAFLAGFDAVEISGSSGYLMCQFLSPLVNKRTDQYGGSFENRCRLPLEVIHTVREAVGEDFPVFYRLGADDLVPDSNTLEDILPFAALAEKAGVDCFNVTGGWHESKVPQLTGDVPRGGLSFLAGAVKGTVSVPVIANNRINSPETAERILALGEADLAGVGRACIADPDFPKKVMEGRADEIRPCIACNQGCVGNIFFGKPLTCHVNSEAGHEWETAAETEDKSGGSCSECRHVLVVGGGPAGCEAALTAAKKGHRVTLWEKTDSLGGQLKLAARVPGKQEYGTLIEYFRKNLLKAGVAVVLNRQLDLSGSDAAGPADRTLSGGSLSELREFDEIIFACGGKPKKTALNTEEGSVPVYTSEQILSGKAAAGRRVVVVGGSFIGCETARFLAADASAGKEEFYYLSRYGVRKAGRIREMTEKSLRNIVIAEKGPKIGYGYEPGTAWTVLADLDRYGVKKLKNTKLVKVTSEGVIVSENGSGQRLIECDSVITSFGSDPDEGLKDFCRSLNIRASFIGNAERTGKSADAISAGHLIGSHL